MTIQWNIVNFFFFFFFLGGGVYHGNSIDIKGIPPYNFKHYIVGVS